MNKNFRGITGRFVKNSPPFAWQTGKGDLATLFLFKFRLNLLKIGGNWTNSSGRKGFTGQMPKNAAANLTIERPFLTIFMATLFASGPGIIQIVDLGIGN